MSHGVGSKNENSKPRPEVSTTEAAPDREGRVGVGEHDKQVAEREVHLIAFPRENGSKVYQVDCRSKTDDNGNAMFQSYLSKLFKKETG